MYNFTFNIPTKIHFGKDTISSLSELKAYGSKVLLVCGGGSIKKNGLYDTAMKIAEWSQTQRLRQSERVLKSVKMRVSTWCLQ